MTIETKIRSTPNLRDHESVASKFGPKAEPGFGELLQSKLSGGTGNVQFSAHAVKRMQERNIQLESHDLERLKGAVEKIKAQGSRESLILSDKGAFIVNVKEQRVITAMDPAELKNNAFTNIDSTILI